MVKIKTEIFDKHAGEYDEWFNKFPAVFGSEVEAVRQMLPPGDSHGIEIGLGTGRFAVALGIKEGIEPSVAMREIALSRGLEVMNAVAEELPYKDLRFDFVLMVSCVNYLTDLDKAFQEAYRVLRPHGSLVIGSIEKDSPIGKAYEARRQEKNGFYHEATFFSTGKLIERLRSAGFGSFEYVQTLFGPLEEIETKDPVRPGYGEGSFVVIKAIKH